MDRPVVRGLLPAALVIIAVVAATVMATRLRVPAEPLPASPAPSDALAAAIGKARTFYDFGHYERAVESYEDAVVLGMSDGSDWYRFARAAELVGSPDPGAYARAYELLGAQDTDLVSEVESALTRLAVPLTAPVAGPALVGEYATGTLVTLQAVVVQLIPGRTAGSEDALYLGEPTSGGSRVRAIVRARRGTAVRVGQKLQVIGLVREPCSPAGEIDPLPCVEAIIIRRVP